MPFPIKQTILQDAATSTAAGVAAQGEQHLGHRFRMRCAAGTCTIQLESSNDGTTFDGLETVSMTADTDEIREVTGPHFELRARISAISGATVTVVLEQYFDQSKGATL